MAQDLWNYPAGAWGALAEDDYRRVRVRRGLEGRVRRASVARGTGRFAWLRVTVTRRAVAADLSC